MRRSGMAESMPQKGPSGGVMIEVCPHCLSTTPHVWGRCRIGLFVEDEDVKLGIGIPNEIRFFGKCVEDRDACYDHIPAAERPRSHMGNPDHSNSFRLEQDREAGQGGNVHGWFTEAVFRHVTLIGKPFVVGKRYEILIKELP